MIRVFRSIRFWAAYPFAMLAYGFRRRWEWNRITPQRWFSSGEMLSRDMELFIDEGRNSLPEGFIEDFVKARDELLSLIKKQMILGGIVFVFLASGYFKVGIDISVSGVSLKSVPGVPEALLLITNVIACYTLILQGNCYILDSAIKAGISSEIDDELKYLYLVRYFPHEAFGGYRPFNQPAIIPNKLHRGLSKGVALFAILLMALTSLAYMAANIFLLFHYLWFQPSFGFWSYLLLGYILALGFAAFMYFTLTRCRMPYRDFTINEELALLEQANVGQWRARLNQVYGRYNELRRDMERRGYLKELI